MAEEKCYLDYFNFSCMLHTNYLKGRHCEYTL